MRNGQNKRMRNRNRKSQNPVTRVYESNGPEVKIRGTASHVAEKYLQLARDAQGSGDPVGAENYYQHAEHYFRIIAAAQEQFRQSQPFYRNEGDVRGDDSDDGDGDDGFQPYGEPFSPQPYPQAQPQQHHRPQPQHQPQPQVNDSDIERLPSFITGGQPAQAEANGSPGGYERDHQQSSNRGDRFSHRRRRRHPGGPRNEMQGQNPTGGEEFNPGNE